jgi:hypothetical protein
MTYDHFLMVAMGCMSVLLVFFIRHIIRDEPTAPSPRRLKRKSSSIVGTEGLPPMGDSDGDGD